MSACHHLALFSVSLSSFYKDSSHIVLVRRERGAWQATVHRVAESDATEVTEHTRMPTGLGSHPKDLPLS